MKDFLLDMRNFLVALFCIPIQEESFDKFSLFAKEHYVCALCGIASATPDNLCAPIRREFTK